MVARAGVVRQRAASQVSRHRGRHQAARQRRQALHEQGRSRQVHCSRACHDLLCASTSGAGRAFELQYLVIVIVVVVVGVVVTMLTTIDQHQFIGIAEWGNTTYLVTEFVPGGDLKRYLRQTDLELPWAVRISVACDVAKALAFLHRKNIMHRDIKSKNVLVCLIHCFDDDGADDDIDMARDHSRSHSCGYHQMIHWPIDRPAMASQG